MALSEDTPVTLPGHRRAESNGLELVDNAVPEPIPVEETGRVSSVLYAAIEGTPNMTPESFLEDLAQKIFEKGGNGNSGGDGDDPGSKTLKEIKRHKWLAPIVALLFGSGGMVGSYYALKAQTASNTAKVETIEPRIEKNTEDILLIKVDVTDFSKSVGVMQGQQTEIVDGINALKQEKVDKLAEDLKKAEREINRLRRGNR